MFAKVNDLLYWKSPHNDTTCNNAYGVDSSNGIFAIADESEIGACEGIWAHTLVDHFLNIPLMSTDPFEVEWWVRQAQDNFATQVPALGWDAYKDVQASLVGLRIVTLSNTSAYAELLAFGDCCIMIGSPDKKAVSPFPLEKSSDFHNPPVRVPAKRGTFNRYFHRCVVKAVELLPSDIVVLVTKPLAKWIISAGNGRYGDRWDAFQELVCQTLDTYPNFIDELRNRREMVNDVSSALVITVTEDAKNSRPLGTTNIHQELALQARKKAFEEALQARNRELVAIYYGDGSDLKSVGLTIAEQEIARARLVADALKEVSDALNATVHDPNSHARIQSLWNMYAPILQDEPCAEDLRQRVREGISVDPNVASPALPATKRVLRKVGAMGEHEETLAQGGNQKIANPRRLRVFLCHSSGDKLAVRMLYQRLKACNIDPWLDEESLLPGQNWEQEIRKAVRDSDIVLVCLSLGSISKTGFVQKEIKFALDVADEQPEGTIFLIPVRLEECNVPERLKHLHYVNLFQKQGFEFLIRALKARSTGMGNALIYPPTLQQVNENATSKVEVTFINADDSAEMTCELSLGLTAEQIIQALIEEKFIPPVTDPNRSYLLSIKGRNIIYEGQSLAEATLRTGDKIIINFIQRGG